MSDITLDAPVRRAPFGSTVFDFVLRRLAENWTFGELTIVAPGGLVRRLSGPQPGREATLVVRDFRFAGRVLASGDIGFAEGYMAGEWDSPDLAAVLESLVSNYDHIRRLFDGGWAMRALNALFHRLRDNSKAGARRNIEAHYDLGNAFYAAWLDETMTYSAARFSHPGQSLAEAQRHKYRGLARMMDLQPGHTVAEIGCGWGGFALFAAGEVGATVTGVTLSREQFDLARRRAFEAGLAERVDIRLMDYRDLEGTFDRVASIEMFEAVGHAYWGVYFDKLASLLKPGGRAGLQVITIQDALFDEYAARTDFIQRYVFPGGALPSEARLAPLFDPRGLRQSDIERFGIDYADTLALWARRFEAAYPEIAGSAPGFDVRFGRLWRFYLAYCEAGFRSRRTDVVQMVLDKAG